MGTYFLPADHGTYSSANNSTYQFRLKFLLSLFMFYLLAYTNPTGSHQSFEEYVFRYITGPLQMNATGFDYTKKVKQRMAVGYLAKDVVAPLINMGTSP